MVHGIILNFISRLREAIIMSDCHRCTCERCNKRDYCLGKLNGPFKNICITKTSKKEVQSFKNCGFILYLTLYRRQQVGFQKWEILPGYCSILADA